MYMILMELLWLGEINSAELQTEAGRAKLRQMISERLKDRSSDESKLPDNYTLSDILTLPEGMDLPESIQKLPQTMQSMTESVTSTVSATVKAVTESQSFNDLKDKVIPKDSKLGKFIRVYQILSEEEAKEKAGSSEE